MITQFDIYNSTSNAIANVNIGYPRAYGYVSAPVLQGTGSLQFEFIGQSLKANVRPGSQLGFGFRIGEIKTQVQAFEATGGTGVYAFGIYCMGNESNLTLGSGNCYLLMFDNANSRRSISILKNTSGVGFSAISSIATLPPGDYWLANTTFTMGLEWRVSGTTITLQGKTGLLSDFSDLSTIISGTDSIAAFVASSLGEGLWGDSRTQTLLRVIFDNSQWAGRA